MVIDETEKLKQEDEEISAQLKGFNLSINYDKIYAKKMLIKAMSKLQD